MLTVGCVSAGCSLRKMIKPNKSDLFPIITIAQQCVILVENLKPSFL